MATDVSVQEHESITYSLEPIWPSSVRPFRRDSTPSQPDYLSCSSSESIVEKRRSLKTWLRCGLSDERTSISSDAQSFNNTPLGRLRRRLIMRCFHTQNASGYMLPGLDGPRPSVDVQAAAPPPSLFTMADAQNYIEVAFMYLDRGDMVGAEKNVRTAIRIADNNNVSARSRADLLTVLAIATGEQRSSERNLATALAIYRHNPPTGNFGEIALRSLLAVLCRQGRFEESVEVAAHYRQFIPKNKPKQTFSLRRAK